MNNIYFIKTIYIHKNERYWSRNLDIRYFNQLIQKEFYYSDNHIVKHFLSDDIISRILDMQKMKG